MTVLKILKEIESNLLGIDNDGNLRLDTKGKLMGQIADADIPAFGGSGVPSKIAITNAAGTSNISNVTFQVADLDGSAVAGNFLFDLLLSDSSGGYGLTSSAADTLAAASSGGEIELVMTAAKSLRVQTNSSGAFVLAVTSSAKHTYYPVGYWAGRAFVGAQLTSGSYG